MSCWGTKHLTRYNRYEFPPSSERQTLWILLCGLPLRFVMLRNEASHSWFLLWHSSFVGKTKFVDLVWRFCWQLVSVLSCWGTKHLTRDNRYEFPPSSERQRQRIWFGVFVDNSFPFCHAEERSILLVIIVMSLAPLNLRVLVRRKDKRCGFCYAVYLCVLSCWGTKHLTRYNRYEFSSAELTCPPSSERQIYRDCYSIQIDHLKTQNSR